MSSDLTSLIDTIYEHDCCHRQSLAWSDTQDGSFLTGSAAEGAFICRGLWNDKPNIEIDVMTPFASISETQSLPIFVATNLTGYYRLKWNEALDSSFYLKFPGCLPIEESKDKVLYLDSRILRYFKRLQGHGAIEEGKPNIYSEVNSGIRIEEDSIPCIELSFWPDFMQPWFERQRYWPSPETIEEIRATQCHLVLKSTPGSIRNDEWRISFSKAEVILANKRTDFQNKCYLLAKHIYYAKLSHEADEETGRHISSYLLKTTMLYFLEQTSSEQWEDWEKNKSYLQVSILLYERLATSFSHGHLPSYFVEDLNLLAGYSESCLQGMEFEINLLLFGWRWSNGITPFHFDMKHVSENDFCTQNSLSEEDQKEDRRTCLHGIKSLFECLLKMIKEGLTRFFARKDRSCDVDKTLHDWHIQWPERVLSKKHGLKTGKIKSKEQKISDSFNVKYEISSCLQQQTEPKIKLKTLNEFQEPSSRLNENFLANLKYMHDHIKLKWDAEEMRLTICCCLRDPKTIF